MLKLRAVALLSLSMLVLAITAHAAHAEPALTMTPDMNLVDGNVVTVDGTGFTETGQVGFCQGVFDDTPSPFDCDSYPSLDRIGLTGVDSAGDFSAEYTVHRFITVSGVGTVDCAQPSANCAMGAANLDGTTVVGPLVIVPLDFAPQPPPSVTVTPDTGLVDGDTLTVDVSDFPPSWRLVFCQGAFDGSFSHAECGEPFDAATTDSTGSFSVQLTARRFIGSSPFVPPTIDCAAPSAACAVGVGPISLEITALTPITFAVQPPPDPIFGTVTGPDDSPLAGVDVWAYAPGDGFVGSLQSTTDAQGMYSFDAVEPNVPYRVLFFAPNMSTLASEWFDSSPSRLFATEISLASGEFLQANAQLEEAGTISGVVTDGNGSPVAGVPVKAFGPADTWVATAETSTAPDGSYALENLRAATYRLRFLPSAGSGLAPEWYDDACCRRAATPVGVLSGQTITGIDAQLDAQAAISGTTTDSNASPVEGAIVRVYGPGDRYVGSYIANTAADGSYVIGRMLPGDQYLVRFEPPGGSALVAEWYDNAPLRTAAQAVVATAGQTTTGVDAVFDPLG